MTAEIVVFNREGVAMATDSAVTSHIGDIDKISSSANKLFSLSDRYPVGIMVYGNSSFMSIPWETIIKVYRSTYLPTSGFSTLGEYARNFISYLSYENIRFHRFAEGYYIESFVSDILMNITRLVLNNARSRADPDIGESALSRVIERVIDDAYAYHHKLKTSYMSLEQSRTVFNRLRKHVRNYIDAAFDGYPLRADYRSKLYKLLVKAFSDSILDNVSSGVIFAGFGEDEFLPMVEAFKIEGIVKSKQGDTGFEILKYEEDRGKSSSADTHAAVIPYAQSEMVCRFMDGVDPEYQEAEDEFLTDLYKDFASKVVSQLDRYDEREKRRILQTLSRYGKRMTKAFSQSMQEFAHTRFVEPTIEAVTRLSKSELALMAEALVYVTSLKRKISPDSETVTEPIDVALISKGDGFVWVRRKHYFDPKLNPAYFMKRSREVLYEGPQKSED